jgi:hypothetical protein
MTDFLFEDDLEIINGDFKVGNSDRQHTKHILIANKGEYEQIPEIGVGMENMLADDQYMQFLIEAKKNLEYDGQTVENISFEENQKLNVISKYNL